MNQKSFSILIIAVVIAIFVGAVAYLYAVDPTPTPTNLIKSIRTVPSSAALGGKAGVEIEVSSDKEFPVRNDLAVLRIGAQEFTLSRYPESGDTHTLIFTLTPEEFAKTATGDPVTVQYGRGDIPGERWDFGPLDKNTLNNSLHGKVLSISANPRTVSSPTFEDQIAAWNLAYDAGARGQTLLHAWSQLEPKNKMLDTGELSKFIDNLVKIGFVIHLNIAVLNTTAKETPSDLKNVRFNSSQMKGRFKSLIDALVPIIGSKVTYLAIGNEVDVYLSSHPDEWDAYREFYEYVAQYVRAKLPGVKVGVTVTYIGATGSDADKILALNRKSDVWMFSYYPLDVNFYPLGPEAVITALPRMVELAGGRPVVIQETGYPSSPLLKSSEKDQAAFVTNTFKTWMKVGERISFIDFWSLHEMTQDQVNEWSAYYGMSQNEELKAYLGSVGLRHSDGTAKPVWRSLIEGGRAMGLPVKKNK